MQFNYDTAYYFTVKLELASPTACRTLAAFALLDALLMLDFGTDKRASVADYLHQPSISLEEQWGARQLCYGTLSSPSTAYVAMTHPNPLALSYLLGSLAGSPPQWTRLKHN